LLPYAALSGNRYDGHTRHGHSADASAHRQQSLHHRCRLSRPQRPTHHKFKVYTSGQKRRVTPQIKREFKRRAAIEPVIGHLKEHHRMGRNQLALPAAMPSTPCSPPPRTVEALLLRILIALSLPAQPKSV
jgi:IS5 family transposase